MKQSILLLWCCLGALSFLSAQSNARIDLQNDIDTVLVSNQLCVKVMAFHFQDIDSLQFSILYNGQHVRFDSLRQSSNVSGTARATGGTWLLEMSWKKGEGSSPIADSTALFEICMKATGSTTSTFGGIQIVNYPNPVKGFDAQGQPQNIDYQEYDWDFTFSVFPNENISLAVTDTVVMPGEPLCLRVEVLEFKAKLVSMQFGMKWDPAMLQFDSIGHGDVIAVSAQQNFGFTKINQGELRFLWIDQMTLQGLKLEKGDVFFEICFTALDTLGATEVRFDRNVLEYEFYDADLIEYGLDANNSLVSISEEPQVWPGDTNRDGIVNQNDLLQIGLAYGTVGANRRSLSTEWSAQLAPDWQQTSPTSQINFKHFDTDGNGLIELLDANAIENNWQLTTDDELQKPDPIDIRAEGAPLFVKTSPIFPAGQAVAFDIILGEEDNQAQSAYGIAFSIVYDEALAQGSNLVSATFDASWLGTVGEDLLVLEQNNPAENRIDIALVRTDGANREGFGAIGQLHFTVPAYAGEATDADTVALLPFRIENVQAIDAAEMTQLTTPMETTAVVDLSTSISNPAIAHKIMVFPNPARDVIFLKTADLQIEKVEIFNNQGQRIQYFSKAITEISTQNFPAGTYTLRLLTDAGIAIKSIIVLP